jgi:RNA polymerase sigma-70 factor (ECF subfamily)
MTMNSTDESLMAAVREGGHAELGELFDRHHRALYEFFYRMSGDRTASESLVQDVFYRILEYRDTFRDEGRFNSWFYRIARNARHEICGKPDAAPACGDDPELMRKVSPSGAHDPGEDKAATLRCALLKLPEDQREFIVFSQYQHLTPNEIAELLDIEVPTAMVHVHRAMMELRDLYRKLSG